MGWERKARGREGLSCYVIGGLSSPFLRSFFWSKGHPFLGYFRVWGHREASFSKRSLKTVGRVPMPLIAHSPTHGLSRFTWSLQHQKRQGVEKSRFRKLNLPVNYDLREVGTHFLYLLTANRIDWKQLCKARITSLTVGWI